MTKTEFNDYCGSPGYHNNLSTGLSPLTKSATVVKSETTKLTASVFRRGVSVTRVITWNLKMSNTLIPVTVVCSTGIYAPYAAYIRWRLYACYCNGNWPIKRNSNLYVCCL
jgi:hypothetical protein